MNASGTSNAAIGVRVRRHIRAELYDDSGDSAGGIAIYTLSDPRSIRDVRYVGQTKSPARRFAQHLNTVYLDPRAARRGRSIAGDGGGRQAQLI